MVLAWCVPARAQRVALALPRKRFATALTSYLIVLLCAVAPRHVAWGPRRRPLSQATIVVERFRSTKQISSNIFLLFYNKFKTGHQAGGGCGRGGGNAELKRQNMMIRASPW